ncbi:unnamed protein product [Camellia sinensis]
MDLFKLTSSSTKNISQSFVNKNHLRSVNYSEGIYLRKITESDISPNPIIITPHENLYLGRKKAEEEGEIDVFGAEKYFNHVDDENLKVGAIKYKYAKDEQSVEIGLVKPKIQPGTPSIYSESSSNIQNVLLQNVVRNSPRRNAKKRDGKKGLLACLGCNCSCNDRDSVETDEQFSESKSKTRDGTVSKEHIENGHHTVDLAQINASRLHCMKIDEVGNSFTFPILNSKAENLAIKARLHEHDDDDDEQREFFEVFGSPVLEKKIQAGSDGIIIHTDAESDASSDLFEIESLKNNPNYPYLLRQASDGMSSCVMQTTCYAPSEASIEWSVGTASAVDFSAMSDTADLITSSEVVTKAQKMGLNEKTGVSKEADRQRSGILLSCKSHKAVRVAGDAYRTNGKANPDPRTHGRGLGSFGPVTQLQPEN